MSQKLIPLLESAHISESCLPIKSSTSSSQSYILSIANLPEHYATSASAPSNTIDIFDKSTLLGVQTLPGHEKSTTSLRTFENIPGIQRKGLISSGMDGSIKIWDDRSNSHSIKMTNLGNSTALLCCDVSLDGMTVAGGTKLQGEDALIIYWDPRQPAVPLRTHASTHSDDITSVNFAPSRDPILNCNVLLSGSSDGLISTSNAEEDDEDEAVLQVSNWGCSVSQTGWIQGGSNVWAASDMETFSTWSRELDPLLNIHIREPSVHTSQRTWVTDYLITCHNSSTSTPKLSFFVGSNEGDVALISSRNPYQSHSPWYLHKLWTHGHIGVVRSLLYDEENQVIITGGEDSKLHAWAHTPSTEEEWEDEDVEMDVDMPSTSPARSKESHGSNPKKRDLDDDLSEQEGKRIRR